MKKMYCFVNYGNNIDIDTRNAQLMYLRYVAELTPSQIANYVNLAYNTIRNYIYKLGNEFIELGKKLFTQREPSRIEWECEKIDNKTPCAYILETYNEIGQLQYLKVGKTIQMQTRLKSHTKDYYKIKVKKIYPFKYEDTAFIMESVLRLTYNLKYASKFVKNDRFEEISYNATEIETNDLIKKMLEILKNY